jgi:3-oxoacyl-[acyl-carrier protein] reductase
MDLGIQGRVAVVTGGAGGLGSEMVRALANEGCAIAILDRDTDAAVALEREISALGGSLLVTEADMTSSEEVNRAIDQVLAEHGKIDILVNCAGGSQDGPITEMSDERWRKVIDTNLTSAFYASRAAVPSMIAGSWGRIINISSRSLLGDYNRFSYSAAKAGMIGFTSSLALDLAQSGITVNAIAPGMVETPHAMSVRYYEDFRRRALAQTPLGRMGTPEDIASAVLFLASERSSFITGELLFVTGGRFSTSTA